MRRLLHIPLNAATVLSLVLCVATVAAWVRSYRLSDQVLWVPTARAQRCYGYESGMGLFTLRLLTTNHPMGVDQAESKTVPITADWRRNNDVWVAVVSWHGFAAQRASFINPGDNTSGEWQLLTAPYWFVLLLTAILPAARLVGWRRRARRLRMHPTLCQHCGYDCRATPDRCPECGRVTRTI